MTEICSIGSSTKNIPRDSGGGVREERESSCTPEKGKPFERMGRKTTGLNPGNSGHDSRAAGLKQCLLERCGLLRHRQQGEICMKSIGSVMYRVRRTVGTSKSVFFRATGVLRVAIFAFVAACTLVYPLKAHAAQATLGWAATTSSNVSGYKLYYGNTSGTYSQSVDVGNTTSYTMGNLTAGKIYYFAAVAYDASGNQSDYSNEVSKSIPVVQYTVIASAGTGGAISPSGSTTLNSGTSKSYAIVPATGYKIADVKVDGTSVGAVSAYTFSTVTASHTISATFSAQITSTTPHWNDATTQNTVMLTANPNYMVWSPVVADATAKVTSLRVNIGLYGQATQVRLGLYDKNGKKLTEGTSTVSAAGYKTITVPSVSVTKGNTYFIAVQAASSMLKTFNCGAKTGGYAAKNTYSKGFPSSLPSGWSDYLVTSGMYVQ